MCDKHVVVRAERVRQGRCSCTLSLLRSTSYVSLCVCVSRGRSFFADVVDAVSGEMVTRGRYSSIHGLALIAGDVGLEEMSLVNEKSKTSVSLHRY